MAAGIPVSKETTSETQLDGSAFEMGPEFVLPHQLPRPAHVPTAAPPPVEPLYQPQHGKPIGTFFLCAGLQLFMIRLTGVKFDVKHKSRETMGASLLYYTTQCHII